MAPQDEEKIERGDVGEAKYIGVIKVNRRRDRAYVGRVCYPGKRDSNGKYKLNPFFTAAYSDPQEAARARDRCRADVDPAYSAPDRLRRLRAGDIACFASSCPRTARQACIQD